MDPSQSYSNNSILEGTFLDSKYFDPVYLFNQGYSFFQNLFSFSVQISHDVLNLYYFILFLLAVFFMFIIAYCLVRIFEIRKKEHHHVEHEIAEFAHHQREREQKAKEGADVSTNPRWVQTLHYVFSSSPGDWKLAIIEADSMLDSLMDQLGFHGESLGEKLRMANQENFKHLTKAWEVHNIRNRIAHEGVAFEISHHEAKRIIAIYENIFRDFAYI